MKFAYRWQAEEKTLTACKQLRVRFEEKVPATPWDMLVLLTQPTPGRADMENSEKLLAGICDLKGSQMAQMAFLKALIQVLPEAALEPLKQQLELQSEIVKTVLLNSPVSEQTRDALSRDLALFQAALSER